MKVQSTRARLLASSMICGAAALAGGQAFAQQAASTTATKSINVCVLLTDSSGNPTSLCTTFSQRATAARFIAPVAFYGFGSGVHEVIFENPTQGTQFNVDKILVK